MPVKFIGQPHHTQVGDLLTQLFQRSAEGEFSTVHILSAFAKTAGVARLEGAIGKARAKATIVHAYVGIDHDGTSREALSLLHKITDSLHVIHSSRTM